MKFSFELCVHEIDEERSILSQNTAHAKPVADVISRNHNTFSTTLFQIDQSHQHFSFLFDNFSYSRPQILDSFAPNANRNPPTKKKIYNRILSKSHTSLTLPYHIFPISPFSESHKIAGACRCSPTVIDASFQNLLFVVRVVRHVCREQANVGICGMRVRQHAIFRER
jgi:hypothetical protein